MTHKTKLCWVPLLLLSSVILGLGFKSQMGRLLQLPNELPAQTCADAQDNGLYYGESIPTPPWSGSVALSKRTHRGAPNKLPKITLKGRSISTRDFMPNDLAFQPFEGYPEDIGRVGQVLRDADAGKRIRLTFLGASHTTGDFWTGQIRRVLQADMATSDMGLSCRSQWQRKPRSRHQPLFERRMETRLRWQRRCYMEMMLTVLE